MALMKVVMMVAMMGRKLVEKLVVMSDVMMVYFEVVEMAW